MAIATVTLTCAHPDCGRDFTRIAWRVVQGRTHYCSRACFAASQRGVPKRTARPRQRAETTCAHCGVVLWVKPAQLKRRTHSFCCQAHCYAWRRANPKAWSAIVNKPWIRRHP